MYIFNQRLSQIRQERRLTIKELAIVANVPVPSMNNYIKCREAPYDVLIRLSDYLNVSIEWMIGKSDDYTTVKETEDFSKASADYMRYSDGVNDLIRRIKESEGKENEKSV